MTQIIAFIGRKGGITKSTLTANTAAGLSRRGFRVLIVETDGQGSLSNLVGVQPHDGFTRLIADDAEFADVMVQVPQSFTEKENPLYLISSSDRQMQIENLSDTSTRIYNRFQELRGYMDFVLVDTSPDINEINNAWFYTADWLVLPTLCEMPSIDIISEKTLPYWRQARKVGEQANMPVAKILGVVPNRYDKTIDAQKFALGALSERVKMHAREENQPIRLFGFMRNIAGWQTAATARRSIYTYWRIADPRNRGEYRHLVDQSKMIGSEIEPLLDALTALVDQSVPAVIGG